MATDSGDGTELTTTQATALTGVTEKTIVDQPADLQPPVVRPPVRHVLEDVDLRPARQDRAQAARHPLAGQQPPRSPLQGEAAPSGIGRGRPPLIGFPK